MSKHNQIKHIVVSVTNDLVTDQRVNKVCLSLLKNFGNIEITLVGRQLKNSLPLENRIYKTKRMNLFFEKGFAFYAEYNLRLFFLLLFKKTDLLVSNDLDTLLPNFLVSKFKGKNLVYDSHEYFCYVPELINRPFVQNIWKKTEGFIFPKLKQVITVSQPIAELYQQQYQTKVQVIRNLPLQHKAPDNSEIKSRIGKELGITNNQKIIIYQGAVNIDRGIEEAILAMKNVENAKLLIIGLGDVFEKIKTLVTTNQLENKVLILNRIPFEKLRSYTLAADLGISLEKDTNLNYRYSLPNKLFDYIAAGIPVLASPLPEVYKIFEKYHIGELINSHEPEHIASKINFMLENKEMANTWKKNLLLAKEELCWEKEELKLIEIYRQVIE